MRRLQITSLLALLVVGLVMIAAPAVGVDNENDPKYWEQEGWTCDKLEPIPEGTLSWTLSEPPTGNAWTLLVLKSGQDQIAIEDPIAGVEYSNQSVHSISHVIRCWADPGTTTTTTIMTTTTATDPSTTTTTTSSTTTTTSTPSSSTTTTVPVTTTTTDPTTSTTSTTSPTTVPQTTTTPSTLPYGGMNSTQLAGLALSLLALGGMGVLSWKVR